MRTIGREEGTAEVRTIIEDLRSNSSVPFPNRGKTPYSGYLKWSGNITKRAKRKVGHRCLCLSNRHRLDSRKQQTSAVEDVLSVYTRPYNPARPQVCMDEINTQLLADIPESLPMEPGNPARQDYEYERQGVCNVFLACEPLVGRRYSMVASQRTKQEWAQFIRRVSDEYYPTAEKIVLVMDNLNTHTLAALYEVFPVSQARRLSQRFEVHYTPKHASWLNMAEIELSAVDRQCLSQRLASLEIAVQQVAAWTTRRNQQQVTINWRFTAQDASIKLKHLYPSIQD